MERTIRIGLLGCGTIGGYVLDRIEEGKIQGAKVVVVCGRTEKSKGREKVRRYGLKWVTDPLVMLQNDVDVVIESASHEALKEYGKSILEAGVDLIPTSVGALVDKEVFEGLKEAARQGESRLHVPSGGIGGLDALQAMIHGRMNGVTMTTRKPPAAWKDIPYVERMQLDLDNMKEPTVLYDGPARDCVKEFPQNINIAAALSLAGIGFDATRIRIVADPTITRNTHEIVCWGEAGKLSVTLENVPVPENPKTTYMACLSTLGALRRIRSSYRVGT